MPKSATMERLLKRQKIKIKSMFEINPIKTKIIELTDRTAVIRGYL